MSSNFQTLADASAAVANAVSAATADYTSLEKQYEALQGDLTSVNQENEALTSQNQQLKDDLSAAVLASAMSNVTNSRLQLLSQANFLLNLHRLPFTTDPNARPLRVWFQPSNSGDTGGTSTRVPGTGTIAQNDDGSTYYAIAPGYPYNAFYFSLHLLNTLVALRRFLQIVQFEIADEDVPNAMAQETNFEHSYQLFRYNHGFQALLGTDVDCETGKTISNVWRHYDISFKSPITGKVGNWRVLDGIPFDRGMFGTGNKVELVHEIEQSADPAQGMQIVSVTINGTRYAIGRWTAAKATTWGPYLDNGFQLDSLKSAAPWKAKVWNMEAWWI